MRSFFFRAIFALGCVLPGFAAAQSVSVAGGAPQTQTFDSLASTGNSSTLPTGWFLHETSATAPANTQYTADNGGMNSGTTYSYGTTGSSERAFGGIQSNTNRPTIGARLSNDTGGTLTELQVEYEGEQWRIGTQSRADRLDFEYSLNATSLTTGTWTSVDSLDFTSPNTTSAVGALDGNLAANGASKLAVISGLALANGATMWVRWSDFDPGTNEDGLAIDNVVFAVPGDSPPALGSSTPSDGASAVARTQSITLNFTEPVTTTGAWYTLVCVDSAMVGETHTATVSGTGATRVLDPDVDFGFDEDCTLTLDPAQISDNDPPADALTGNTRIGFRTEIEPVDVPPTVESVVPAAGATNIAPNASLTVKFSEPVTTTSAAFALSCANSGAHAFTLAGGPSTFTLDPSVDFGELETCTLSIDAEQVFDQDGPVAAMVADFLSSFTTRAGLGNYYQGVDESSCSALRSSLHNLIDDHTAVPYTATGQTDTWDILETADQNPLVSTEILEVYENAHYAKAGGGNANYNREHTWPNSYGFNNLDQNTGSVPNLVPQSSAYTDTHMLWLSDIEYNSNRGSKPYANCPQASGCAADLTLAYNGQGGGAVTYPGNHNWKEAGASEAFGSYEVWNFRKGEMARAILYMDIRYEGGQATAGNTVGQFEPNLVVTDDRNLILGSASSGSTSSSTTAYMGLKSTLMAWHSADPPDASEQLRNDVVFSFQGNRNPFVDHPEWVVIAFESPCGAGTNQAPVLADAAPSVFENAAAGTVVTTLSATDPNAGQTLAYSIVSGNAAGAFALNASSGALTVANAALVDRAVVASYTLVVRATDNGSPVLSDDATVAITITPVNDAPSFTKGSDVVVAEDSGAASLPGWATAMVAGPSDESAQSVSFEVTANTDASLFSAAPGVAPNGTLSFTPAPDANGTATITLRARDNGGTANGGVDASPGQTFTITITPVNELGVANDDSPAAIFEDSGTATFNVLANDVDPDGGSFVQGVGAATGGTTAIGPAGTSVTFTPALNFCGTTSFVYTITGGDTATVSVIVTCVNDAPVATDASGTVAAGSPSGTIVATVSATDVDGVTLSYAITDGNTGGAFAIDATTGAITVAVPGAVQTPSSPFTLTITVSDGGAPSASDTAAVTITVTPRGDAIFSNSYED